MKRMIRLALACAFLLVLRPEAGGCNFSSYTLLSFTTSPGPVYTIVSRLCIGYGRSGVAFGANGSTNSFFTLTIYSTNYGPAAMQAALTGWTQNLQMGTAQNTAGIPPGPVAFSANPSLGPYYGPSGVGWGLAREVDNIFYADPVCYCMDYACVSSSSDCGSPGTHCQNITLTYSGIYPDSIRALGIEGTAPFDGCWPNADMMINLTNLPMVFGEFNGSVKGAAVNLSWETVQEQGTGEFVVERAAGQSGVFNEVGRVSTSLGSHWYQFIDGGPGTGEYQYRILHRQGSGETQSSKIVTVQVQAPDGLSIGALWPQPARDLVWLTVEAAEASAAEWQLWDLQGRLLISGFLALNAGWNEAQIDLGGLPAGQFDLRVKTARAEAGKRVYKL